MNLSKKIIILGLLLDESPDIKLYCNGNKVVSANFEGIYYDCCRVQERSELAATLSEYSRCRFSIRKYREYINFYDKISDITAYQISSNNVKIIKL